MRPAAEGSPGEGAGDEEGEGGVQGRLVGTLISES